MEFTPEEMAIDAADVDASRSPGIGRGREAWEKLLSNQRGLARLDPDVRKAFPDDQSVNEALRKVIELQNMKPRARRKKSA